MTQSEFEETAANYHTETRRWERLQVGQRVYVSSPQGLDIDYFEHEIVSINVPERKAVCIDHSQHRKPTVTISYFHLSPDWKT